MLELTVRLIASLAVVVGLMLVLAKLAGRRFSGRDGAPVQVLHRQQLTRSSSVAVLSVGSRVLVVGSTDHQVSLLTELDPDELGELGELELAEHASDGPDGSVRLQPAHRAEVAAPALAGSVLSAQTWRQALAAATGQRS